MAEDLTIGLPFNLDEGWMGGAYYFQNLLRSLATLSPERQPNVIVITETPESAGFLNASGYPKLSVTLSEHVLRHPQRYRINLLLAHPLPGMESRTLSWIPDFQEHHLPYLFTEGEIAQRVAWHRECLKTAGLLLSSESAHADLTRFYGDAECPVFIVPFATSLPENLPSLAEVGLRYDLPERYFFSPNQFWIHKNHIVILAALRTLAERGVFPSICFSGREFDSRAAEYGQSLREMISSWGLEDQVQLLGFLPREDQVTLMDHAIAILQPSRFEGWSTVVEDAKALNQHVVASNLDVHQEQLKSSCDFFHPSDHVRLADLIERYWIAPPERPNNDYRDVQRACGEALLSTLGVLARANPLPDHASAGGEPVGPTLQRGQIVHFRHDREDDIIDMLGVGWARAEATHIWSIGARAELFVRVVPDAEIFSIVLSGNPHVTGGVQQVEIRVNGTTLVTQASISGSELRLDLDCRAAPWRAGGVNRVAVSPDLIASPPPESNDARLLGVCMSRIEVR